MATYPVIGATWSGANSNIHTSKTYIQLNTNTTASYQFINGYLTSGYSIQPWRSPLSEEHHGKTLSGATVNHVVDKEAGWGGEWLYTRCGYAFGMESLLESLPADSKKHAQRMCLRCVPQYLIDEDPF